MSWSGCKPFTYQSGLTKNIGKNSAERAWLEKLPEIVEELRERWKFDLDGDPFTDGTAAWTAPVLTSKGHNAVLKVSWPHEEAREEASALRVWDGDGSVRLYDEDRGNWAMLMERCDPGYPLADFEGSPEEALTIGASLLTHIWSHQPSYKNEFQDLGTVCSQWAEIIHSRVDRYKPPFDLGLVRKGAELLRSLPESSSSKVLLHGDFNPGNILSAKRKPWLAIDPKPMLGDPGYDLEPLIAQIDNPYFHQNVSKTLSQRFELVCEITGQEIDRAIAWAFARTVESAIWQLSRDDLVAAKADMAKAEQLARILEI